MKNTAILSRCVLIAVVYIFICDSSYSFSLFNCKEPNEADLGKVPALPRSFSASMRIHFLNKKYMVEMTYARNTNEGKELIEIKRKNRHVKYITPDKKTLLFVQDRADAHPTCEVSDPGKGKSFLKDDDAGDQGIVLKALEVMMFPDIFDLYSVSPDTETGVFANRYEGCLKEPKINISISFAEENWEMPYTSPLIPNVRYPETVTAEIGDTVMTVLYNRFDPSTPDDTVFQPPYDVYCDGYRADKKLPEIPDFFSYNAEKTVYESAMGLAPVVSHRQVFYDYEGSIARVDFDDAYPDDLDMFSGFSTQQKSIIYDFKSGVQYIIDPFTGQCKSGAYKSTFDFYSFKANNENPPKSTQYFWFNGEKTSYNGQFPVRGMMADVYTGLRKDPATKQPYVVSWFFSTKETRVVGIDEIEENALLRIYVRPETDLEKENVTEINYFGFFREAPQSFNYDITNCFNDSTSKILVLTFPAVESLRGSEKIIGMLTLYTIEEKTGLRAHRINIMKVIVNSDFIYTEFSLLEDFSVKGKNSSNEISLDEALKKLQEAVDEKTFVVKVPSETEEFSLVPVANGLNVFAGDHVRTAQELDYKKGEVIGLTVGMLFLGFLIGFVTLNLIMSRKFGVSLFKKSRYENDPFGESSM